VDFASVPTFSSLKGLEKAVPKLYINSNGVLRLKRILWGIHKIYEWLNYCPQLPPLVSIMLVYLNEEEVFQLCVKLINNSNHLITNKIQFKEFVKEVLDIVIREEESLADISDQVSKVISDMIRKMLIGYFRISCLLKMIVIYLVEGKSLLAKMISSIFSLIFSSTTVKNNINSKNLMAIVQKYTYSLASCDNILKRGYRIRYSIDEVVDVRTPSKVRGSFIPCSKLVSETYMQEILKNIDSMYLNYSTKAVHTSIDPSLSSLLSTASKFPISTAMLLVFLTVNYEMCGFFTDTALHVRKSSYGSKKCIIFLLEPEIKFYTAKTSKVVSVSEKCIKIGKDKPAICIEGEEMILTSNVSQDFANERFLSLDTDVQVCELIVFI
jgi:TLD/Rab-GTPase-TBC domain